MKDNAKTAFVFMIVGLISGFIIGYGAGVTKTERAQGEMVVDTVCVAQK